MNNLNLTDEEIFRINKTFDMMQVPILRYMMYLAENNNINGSYSDIFDLPPLDQLTMTPIIIKDTEKFGDKYITITFDIVDTKTNEIFSYDEYLDNKTISDILIPLVNNGANMILEYFAKEKIKCPIAKKFFQNLNIRLDLDYLIFEPIICSDQTKKIIMLNNELNAIKHYKLYIDPNTNISPYYTIQESDRANICNREEEIINSINEEKLKIDHTTELEFATIQKKLSELNKIISICNIVDKSELPQI